MLLLFAFFVGKCISSNKDHFDMEAVTTRARALKLIASHRFADFKSISHFNDISMIALHKLTIKYDKPLLLGWVVSKSFLKGVK